MIERAMPRWMRPSTGILLSILLSMGAVGCAPAEEGAEDTADRTTADEVRRDLTDAYESIESYSYEQREELEAYAERTVRELERDLEGLRERMRESAGEARAGWQDTEAELEDELSEARRWLDQVGETSEEAWADARDGLAHAMRRLEDGIEEARSALSDEEGTAS